MSLRAFRAAVVRQAVLLAALFVLAGCASSKPKCSFSDRDRAWLDRSVEAWSFASREISGISKVPAVEAVVFSSDCVLRSRNALTSDVRDVRWSAAPHDGTIALPDGSSIPAGVTSYTSGKEDLRYFVMSTPSVWEAGGVGSGARLETMMVAVMLHEASHVAQIGPYGGRLGALIERSSLPDSFNDDTLQQRFRDNEAFAASVKEETRLFNEAAAAKEVAEALRLARAARKMMRERQAKWLVGDDAYFVEAEDIWLTFEGAGQWTAYQWLIHPRGGAESDAEALDRFTKGRWWSQTEGFAVVMALDRIAGPGWKRHAYGDGAKTLLEMLDDALRE